MTHSLDFDGIPRSELGALKFERHSVLCIDGQEQCAIEQARNLALTCTSFLSHCAVTSPHSADSSSYLLLYSFELIP